jgi:hypothetical protein
MDQTILDQYVQKAYVALSAQGMATDKAVSTLASGIMQAEHQADYTHDVEELAHHVGDLAVNMSRLADAVQMLAEAQT